MNTGTAPAFAPGRPLIALTVPIDARDERAMPLAASLATKWGLPVRLVHVVPDSGTPSVDLATVAETVAARWPQLAVDAEQLTGDDVATVVSSAAGADSLLIVATDNANAWSFKDSVAERLVHRSSGPLVLVGPQANGGDATGDVVVAYDGRPASAVALDAAVALAPAIGRNLWLVRVVPEGIGSDAVHDPDIGLELSRRAESIDPRLSARWEVIRSNDPVSSIESFAGQVQASFIVAGARGRADQTRTTMSSITMGLVANAGRPVLVVGQ